jgi:hypothetical protein
MQCPIFPEKRKIRFCRLNYENTMIQEESQQIQIALTRVMAHKEVVARTAVEVFYQRTVKLVIVKNRPLFLILKSFAAEPVRTPIVGKQIP